MKENFISVAPDEESSAQVSLVDQNKTLMIDQYTTDVDAGNPEFVEDIQNIGDAFAHFKPKVDVTFTDAEGGAVEETLKFGELRDFEAQGGKGRLVQNSPFLSGVKEQIDTNDPQEHRAEPQAPRHAQGSRFPRRAEGDAPADAGRTGSRQIKTNAKHIIRYGRY